MLPGVPIVSQDQHRRLRVQGRRPRHRLATLQLVERHHRLVPDRLQPLDLFLGQLPAGRDRLGAVERVDQGPAGTLVGRYAQQVERPGRLLFRPIPTRPEHSLQREPGVDDHPDPGKGRPELPRGEDRVLAQPAKDGGGLDLAVLVPGQRGALLGGRDQLVEGPLAPLDPEGGGDDAVEGEVGGLADRPLLGGPFGPAFLELGRAGGLDVERLAGQSVLERVQTAPRAALRGRP